MKIHPLPPRGRRAAIVVGFAPAFALFAGALAVVPVAAQEAHDMVIAQAPGQEARVLLQGDDTLAFASSELGGERIVKGAPYCADAINESIQPLADGNRIVRRQTTRLCRDGEGRTRQETERDGKKRVYLRDPVAQEQWLLDPERKIALRMGPHHAMGLPPHDASAWREYSERMRDYAERMREWSREFGERMRREFKPGAGPTAMETPPNAPPTPAPPTPAAPPAPALISPGETQRDLQVRVLRLDGSDLPAPPPGAMVWTMPLPPNVALRSQLWAPRGQGVSTSLGSKDIEGVRANGERTTWTIEAGKFGNEKPIVITRDVWTSPDLMLTMYTRDFDPRSGEVIYRLANLKRGEPDAALMRVPGDYEVRGGKAKARPGAAPASRR